MTRRRGRPAGAGCPPSAGEAGYNLVILAVFVTIMSIVVATALPAWTNFARRDKEAELIFRGMQYAEAIRVFQQRQGRLPVRLEELVEVEPRAIRQLYPDPMSESGKWGLLIQGAQPVQGGRQGAPGAAAPADPRAGQDGAPASGGATPPAGPGGAPGEVPRGVGFPGRPTQSGGGNMIAVPPAADEEEFGAPTQRTAGPIVGVYSAEDEESLRSFFGQSNYSRWHFHVGLIPTPVMLGGDSPAPRVHSNWLGKPFRSDLAAPATGAPQSPGQELTGRQRDQRPLQPSRFRPNKKNSP